MNTISQIPYNYYSQKPSFKANFSDAINEKTALWSIRLGKLDPNLVNKDGETMFQVFVKKNYLSVVDYITAKEKYRNQCLRTTAPNKKGALEYATTPEMKQLLISRGAKITAIVTPIQKEGAQEIASKIYVENPIVVKPADMKPTEKQEIQITQNSQATESENKNQINYFDAFEEVSDEDENNVVTPDKQADKVQATPKKTVNDSAESTKNDSLKPAVDTTQNVEKTIDCGITDAEHIKQTVINVSVPSDYIGKDLYLVLKENQELFIKSIQAGGDIDEGLFIQKCTMEETNVKLLIDTPLSAKNYVLFLVKPEDEILYLKHDLQEINYDVTEVNFEFRKETKKQIEITAIRGNEPLNNHEVYLIETEKWPAVEDIVKNQHGHPESDMYVEKKTIVNGKALFELFCTEGTKDYVVYIPKWNTEYYDSYQKLEVTVNSTQESYELKFDFPYVPPTGGGAITKTVDIEVTVSDFEGYSFGWAGVYVYVLNDSEKLKDAIYSIGYTDFEGLYKSDISVTNVNELPFTFTVKSVEISTDKEVAIFIYPVLQGFSQMLSVKREPGANITNGFKVSLTKDNLENIPY